MKAKFLLWGQQRIEKGAWMLAPLSWLWGLVTFCKNVAYDRGWISQAKVACPVVSIGNLVAGGTGKTPLVVLLASSFEAKRVAILSRGYGKYPDEALLLERRLKHAKIYVGKDRVALAREAVQQGAELILLDDGFQYRKLFRDFDVVTLSGEDPFGRGHYLPFGFLRDSPKRLKQADALFVMGNPKKPIPSPYTLLETKVNRVLDVYSPEERDIKGRKVALFSGIAKPHLFKKIVEKEATVVCEKILADHERIEEKALREFSVRAKGLGAIALLCTEKDFVKIPSEGISILPIFFLEISSYVAQGSLENLIEKIAEKIDNQAHE